MEVKVHGFENLTLANVQAAYDFLGKALSKKYGVEIKYTVTKKPTENNEQHNK
ncbi:MAG: hypothetical protein NSGCLCUN01_01081 [uncultured Clostridium sp.]